MLKMQVVLRVGFGNLGGGRDYMSQGFKTTAITQITAVSFQVNGKSGTSTQGYKVWIDEANASSNPSGTVGVGIGGETEILNSALVTGATTKYALTSSVTLTAGTQYCFVIAPWNTTTHVFSANYQDFRCSVSNPYANGRRTHGNTAYNTWNAPDSGNADLLFETWGDEPGAATTSISAMLMMGV